jgi:hypothetical protein
MALVLCSECGKEVSNQAAACPHCGNPLPGQKSRQPPTGGQPKKRWYQRNSAGEFSTGAGCLILAAMLGIPFGLAGWCAESSPPSTSGKSSAPSSCSSSDCVVRDPTEGESVVLAITKESLSEMMSSGSDRAIAVMVLNGSAFLVPQNTSVSIVDRAFGVRKVLVMEGSLTGRTGWTPAEWVVDRK